MNLLLRFEFFREDPFESLATLILKVTNDKEETMKFRMFLICSGLAFAGSAFAFHCPADMKAIDNALASSPKLTAQQLSDVKQYRADGEALHKAGKHQESIDTLAKAKAILNIQ